MRLDRSSSSWSRRRRIPTHQSLSPGAGMARIQNEIGAIGIALAVVLVGSAAPRAIAREHTTTVQQEIAHHEQSLADARAANHSKEVAVELNSLGSLCRQAGRP